MDVLPKLSCAVALAVASMVAGAQPGAASVPVTASTSDGVTFSGLQRNIESPSLDLFLPLAADFDDILTTLGITQIGTAAGDFTAIFPGHPIGSTIIVDDGDLVPFVFDFPSVPLNITLTDASASIDFGGGLGPQISFFTVASLSGSGEGIVDLSRPNLGFLSSVSFLSGALSFGGTGSVSHPLGADLDGDGTDDVLTLSALSFALGATMDLASYTMTPSGSLEISANLPSSGTFSVNPSAPLAIDLGWTIEQDVVVPAVPEPSILLLVALSLAAPATARKGAFGGRRSMACGAHQSTRDFRPGRP